jgi:predicted PurR-regulated permease PerM
MGIGLATFGIATLAGLPHPVLWGVLAAILNYIPYLGPLIVIGTLFLIGLLNFPSIGHAAIAPLAFVMVTTLEGQVITPTVVGHRLTINPFLVVLSIAFWTWMWGPIGAFLATRSS